MISSDKLGWFSFVPINIKFVISRPYPNWILFQICFPSFLQIIWRRKKRLVLAQVQTLFRVPPPPPADSSQSLQPFARHRCSPHASNLRPLVLTDAVTAADAVAKPSEEFHIVTPSHNLSSLQQFSLIPF